MDEAVFFEWFTQRFIVQARKIAPKDKIVLIFDGHSSHISMRTIDEALKNDIILLCLPAHSSHLLQPLDVGVFKTVKQVWRQELNNFYKNNKYKTVSKAIFPSLIKKVYSEGFTPNNAKSG